MSVTFGYPTTSAVMVGPAEPVQVDRHSAPFLVCVTPQGVQIPAAADRRYRAFFLQATPAAVRFSFRRALEHTPAADALAKTQAFFGDRLREVLDAAMPVVEECEQYCPGLKRWLQATGFGNDRRMIAAFARWAEIGNGVKLS